MSVDGGRKNPLVSSIEWRAECKKRAYKTVLSLIEPNITPSQLMESVPTLDPAHYEDVVEERYLGRLCGYPLCDNPVNKASQQKFHISVKDKKVYDLLERKQFCSGWCCKASQYFASQLSTIPLWARQNETLPKIELLSKENNSKSATTKNTKSGTHEAIVAAPSVEDNAVSLECLHISDTKLDKGKVDSGIELLSNEAMAKTSNGSNGTPPQLEDTIDASNRSDISLTTKCDSSHTPSDAKILHHQTVATNNVVNSRPKVTVGPKHYGAPVQKLPPCEKVTSALLQWKTPDTIKFLAGALPDYSKVDDDKEDQANYLPTIDSHNQISMRRRIVTQQLMKGLSPILNHVGLATQQVSGDIVAIVTTFNLQPTNISFQPSLWSAVAAILLLLIRWVNKDLATIISIDNMLPFISKADMSEDNIKKCLEAFKS